MAHTVAHLWAIGGCGAHPWYELPDHGGIVLGNSISRHFRRPKSSTGAAHRSKEAQTPRQCLRLCFSCGCKRASRWHCSEAVPCCLMRGSVRLPRDTFSLSFRTRPHRVRNLLFRGGKKQISLFVRNDKGVLLKACTAPSKQRRPQTSAPLPRHNFASIALAPPRFHPNLRI